MSKAFWAMAGTLAFIISSASWAAPAKRSPVPSTVPPKPRYSVDASNRASLLQLVANIRRVTAPAKSAFETEEQFQSRVRAAAQGAGEYDFYVDFKFKNYIGYSSPFSYIPELNSFIVVLPKEGNSEQQIYLSSDGGTYEGQNAYGAKTPVIRKNSTSLKVTTTGRFIANMIRLPSANGDMIYNPRSCYSMPVDFSDCREVVRYPVASAAAQSIANDLIARIHYKVQLSPDSLKVDYVHVPAKFNSPLEIDATDYELKNVRVEKVSFFSASSGEVFFEGGNESWNTELKEIQEIGGYYERPVNSSPVELIYIKNMKSRRAEFEIISTLIKDDRCSINFNVQEFCYVQDVKIKKLLCYENGKKNPGDCPDIIRKSVYDFGMSRKYRKRRLDDFHVVSHWGDALPEH